MTTELLTTPLTKEEQIRVTAIDFAIRSGATDTVVSRAKRIEQYIKTGGDS